MLRRCFFKNIVFSQVSKLMSTKQNQPGCIYKWMQDSKGLGCSRQLPVRQILWNLWLQLNSNWGGRRVPNVTNGSSPSFSTIKVHSYWLALCLHWRQHSMLVWQLCAEALLPSITTSQLLPVRAWTSLCLQSPCSSHSQQFLQVSFLLGLSQYYS